MRKRRAGRRDRVEAGDPAVPHGKPYTYWDWCCRCDACREAAWVVVAKRRRARGVPERRVFTDAENAEAVRIYQAEGPTVAAAAIGVTPQTIGRWAREAGVRFKTGLVHGTVQGRRRGCNCVECIEGARRYKRAQFARLRERFQRGEIQPKHGKASTYSNYGCRCGPCTRAALEYGRPYQRAYAERQRAKRAAS
jgi:hypothetical protein